MTTRPTREEIEGIQELLKDPKYLFCGDIVAPLLAEIDALKHEARMNALAYQVLEIEVRILQRREVERVMAEREAFEVGFWVGARLGAYADDELIEIAWSEYQKEKK